MDYFPFMKDCLKEFQYPKIQSMDDPEITDIFSKVNREFLVSWILKQIDQDFCTFVENATKEDLAEIIYCHGFCDASIKYKFMNGECESNKQFRILYRMFKHLKSVSDAKKCDQQVDNFPLEQIETCSNFNTNLFPTYGPKRTLTTAERHKKMQDYRQEIEHLRSSIAAAASKQTQNAPSLDPSLTHQLGATMHDIEMNFPDFKRKVLDLMRERDGLEVERSCFGPDFAEKLAACSKNMKVLLEYIQSINKMADFNENNKDLDTVGLNNRSSALMRQIAELCNDVTALKKE
jgi:hypothetical protein